MVKPDGSYNLSILKSLDGDPACCCRYFFEYDAPRPGMGHFIHTYQANAEPLPSFAGEPRFVSFDASNAEALASRLWESLNGDNKVSLFTEFIDLSSGKRDTAIINKHQ